MSQLTIYLPKNTSVTAFEGDKIVFGQALTTASSSGNVVYDLVTLFSTKPENTAALIVKKEGERVHKGEILAKKKNLLSTKMLKAGFDGVLTRIDAAGGKLEITPDNVEASGVVSPVDGKIKKITSEEVVVDFNGTLVFAKQGMGKMKKGILALVSKADEEVGLSAITHEHEKKILLGGHFTRAILEKAYGIGAYSILAAHVDEGDFPYFEEKKIFDASLLLLAKADFGELSKYVGKEAVVEGEHKRVIISV